MHDTNTIFSDFQSAFLAQEDCTTKHSLLSPN